MTGTTDAVDRVLPGDSPPLTWTAAAPVFEFALRSALCGSLRVLPWPPMGCTDYFLRVQDGVTTLHSDAMRAALAHAAGCSRRTRLRATRISRRAEDWAVADMVLAQSLRAGRVQADLAARTDTDLVHALRRLRQLAFRAWAHHAAAALAPIIARDGTTLADVCTAVASLGPLPLWGIPRATGSNDPRPADARIRRSGNGVPRHPAQSALRSLGDAVGIAFSEIRELADEHGRRLHAADLIVTPDAVALLTWEELHEAVSGRLLADDLVRRVLQR